MGWRKRTAAYHQHSNCVKWRSTMSNSLRINMMKISGLSKILEERLDTGGTSSKDHHWQTIAGRSQINTTWTKKAHCPLLHRQTRDAKSAYQGVSCQMQHLNPIKHVGWHVADSLTSGCHSLLYVKLFPRCVETCTQITAGNGAQWLSDVQWTEGYSPFLSTWIYMWDCSLDGNSYRQCPSYAS